MIQPYFQKFAAVCLAIGITVVVVWAFLVEPVFRTRATSTVTSNAIATPPRGPVSSRHIGVEFGSIRVSTTDNRASLQIDTAKGADEVNIPYFENLAALEVSVIPLVEKNRTESTSEFVIWLREPRFSRSLQGFISGDHVLIVVASSSIVQVEAWMGAAAGWRDANGDGHQEFVVMDADWDQWDSSFHDDPFPCLIYTVTKDCIRVRPEYCGAALAFGWFGDWSVAQLRTTDDIWDAICAEVLKQPAENGQAEIAVKAAILSVYAGRFQWGLSLLSQVEKLSGAVLDDSPISLILRIRDRAFSGPLSISIGDLETERG